jgi:hypothetical protein
MTTSAHLLADPRLRLGWFSLLALAATWSLLGQAAALNEFHDAHFLLAYEDHAVRSVRDYGGLPLWDPWSCGGLYALGNPQTRFASPPFLLSLALGAARAAPLIAFAMLVLGMEGTWRYLGLRAPRGPHVGWLAVLIAPSFALNAYLATAWALGWVQFLGFALLPWVLVGAHGAMRGSRRGLVTAGAALGFMLGFGGTYATPITILLAALEAFGAAPRGWSRAHWGRFLGRGALLGAVLAAAAAFRLWPILTELARSPRVMAGTPGHGLGELAAMALMAPGAEPTGDLPGRYFVGLPIALALALPGLLRREVRLPAVVLLLCVALATGYHYGEGPFAWMRELPLFSTLRYPERFLLPAALFALPLVLAGAVATLAWFERHGPRALAVASTVIALALLAASLSQVHAFQRLTGAVSLAPIPDEVHQPFAQARGNRWLAGLFAASNRGSISCGEAYPVVMSPRLRGDLASEVGLDGPAPGEARITAWAPDAVAVEVRLEAPGRLWVNQNHHPGWKISRCPLAAADAPCEALHPDGVDRLLGVALPAGRHTVRFSFSPNSAWLGLALTLGLLAAASLLWWRRDRLGEGASAATLLAGPLVALAATAIALPSEPTEAPVVDNPDGSSILGAPPPPDARALDARLALPVALRAARFNGPDEDGVLHGELWLQVDGPVPRSVGLFVHVFAGERRVGQADHAVVGGTFFLADAPRGVPLRHAFAIKLTDRQTAPLEVYGGLYHLVGDQARVPLESAREPDRLQPDHRLRLWP